MFQQFFLFCSLWFLTFGQVFSSDLDLSAYRKGSYWLQFRACDDMQGIKFHIFAPRESEEQYNLFLSKLLPKLREANFSHKVHPSFANYQRLSIEQDLYGKAITIYPVQRDNSRRSISRLLEVLQKPLQELCEETGISDVEIKSDHKVAGFPYLSWRFGRFYGPKKPSLYVINKSGYLGYLDKNNKFQPFAKKDFVLFNFEDQIDESNEARNIPVKIFLRNVHIATLFDLIKKKKDPTGRLLKLEDRLRKFMRGPGVINDNRKLRGEQHSVFGAEEKIAEVLNGKDSTRKKLKFTAGLEEEEAEEEQLFVPSQDVTAEDLYRNLKNQHEKLNSPGEGGTLPLDFESSQDTVIPRQATWPL